jgi:diguanylate cyclase (GGDEF)-like protein/PAS domain S-box-containing protein
MRVVVSTFRIVFIYTLFSVLWILFSDLVLEFFIKDPIKMSLIQTYKGLFFIGVTSVLLFILIRKQMQQLYEMQKKIKEKQQRLEYVLKGADLGYWDWDYVSNQQWVNDRWLEFLGLSRTDIENDIMDWSQRIHPEDMTVAEKAIQETMKHGQPYTIEFRMRHKNGEWVWIEGSGAVVVWDEAGKKPLRLAGTHRDIGERKKAQEEIQSLALQDSLTHLPNRYFLKQHLAKVVEEEHTSAFLFLDLDFFKNVNDVYGHSVGDRVIQEAAQRFKHSLHEGDFIARVGGDEFVIVTNDVKALHELSQRLIDALANPFDIFDEKVTLGVSIGIALCPEDGQTFEELFKNADTAMYVAKDSGKNCFTFYKTSMTHDILVSTKLDKEIKEAIENDEFILHFQPLIDIQRDDIIGAEVLVRWQHREKGLVFPGDFIPRAEETHAIIALGELIFKKALKQLKHWNKEGVFKGVIAINISSIQIEHEDFIHRVEDLCHEFNVDTSRIELEVTESFIMKNPHQSAQTLQKLKNLGFGISVDDFGTGYSSLSYLKTLPIHKLKIDRSFIKDLPKDKDDRAIVRAIISLAKNLELEVLAEGVETKEQKKFLVENWCDSAQGYLFAKPMSAQDFEEFIRKN